MNVKVYPHEIELETTEVNAGEYNITPVHFEFSEEYENLTKMALFTTCSGVSKKTAILNNECIIPYEVLAEEGQVLLGVYGYEGEEELELRYSPMAKSFVVKKGSYHEGDDPELPPESEWEHVLELINTAITETNNLNLVADKDGNITKITITKKDGTSYDVDVLDGVSLEDIEINDRNLLVTYGGTTENLGQIVPNVQIGTTTTGNPGTNASVVNVGTDLNPILEFTIPQGEPGAIKVQIVNELPQTGSGDTIYLVPLEHPDIQGNNYAEYIWVNGQYELLGKIGVQVDLTDYYTKTETNTLLNGKQDKIDNDHKLSASLVSGLSSVATSGSYNDLSGKPDLSVYELSSNKVVSISSSSTDTQYPSAKCVYDLVGDIETILTTLDVGSGV